MIVVDSSVWIANLRNEPSAAVHALRAIDHSREQVILGDLILLEVLQGARDERHAAGIERELRRFPIAHLLDDRVASQAAFYYRQLRQLGFTIRKVADLVIGTFCIESGYSLLHQDRDFEPMTRHLGLRTVAAA